MTQGVFTLIKSKHDAEKKIKFVQDSVMGWDYTHPLAIRYEVYRNPRSLSQNAMSHIWYREIAKAMAKKGHVVDYDDPAKAWKLWLKKRFLGVSTIKIGKHTLEEIKRTSGLNSAEMAHYLDQVYHWAMNLGIKLSIPKESEYAEIINQQEK